MNERGNLHKMAVRLYVLFTCFGCQGFVMAYLMVVMSTAPPDDSVINVGKHSIQGIYDECYISGSLGRNKKVAPNENTNESILIMLYNFVLNFFQNTTQTHTKKTVSKVYLRNPETSVACADFPGPRRWSRVPTTPTPPSAAPRRPEPLRRPRAPKVPSGRGQRLSGAQRKGFKLLVQDLKCDTYVKKKSSATYCKVIPKNTWFQTCSENKSDVFLRMCSVRPCLCRASHIFYRCFLFWWHWRHWWHGWLLDFFGSVGLRPVNHHFGVVYLTDLQN